MAGRWLETISIMAQAIAQWAVMFLVLIALGRIIRRVTNINTTESPLLTIWLGLGGLLLLSYITHWFIGLAAIPVTVALLLIAASTLLQLLPSRVAVVKNLFAIATSHKLLTGLMVFAVLWLANQTIGYTSNYDSYLYHLSLIDYFADGHLIPGIANLDTRLGFQSSTYNIAALFQGGFWGHQGYRLANGFVLVLLIGESISRFVHLKSRTPRLSDFVLIFGTPLLLGQVMGSADNWITSPSPDTATAALLLVTFAYSFDAFKSYTLSDYSSALILCAMSLTFRPLAIFISAFVILAFFAAIVRKRVSFLQSLPSITLSGFLVLSYLLHNWITSGYFVYPTSLSLGQPSWKVPTDSLIGDQLWTESWAKAPGLSPDEVLGNQNWVGPWFASRLAGFQPYVAIIGLALILKFVQPTVSARRQWKPSSSFVYSIAATLISGFYWFIRMPDVRFGWAIFIAISTFPLATELVKQWGSPSISSNAFRFLIVILVAQTVSGGLLWSSRPHLPRKNTDRGFVEWIPKTQLAILPNNQRFITPGETDQCGRVLLCTKSIHSNITPYTILGRTGYKTDPST